MVASHSTAAEVVKVLRNPNEMGRIELSIIAGFFDAISILANRANHHPEEVERILGSIIITATKGQQACDYVLDEMKGTKS